ncbi:flagellar hook-associated protein FlgK [Collimonas sp.]|jgi:flagellar hook-associated protein 1 FlgK|uniref:flagellar hook-associated protein FlgK n=1 Tax=Collimonas sp. TaxID=1963772 RepID=UPI002C957048|nr:flagellar hook-associated protein FlgK [Collimonas sp.]HWW07647.1 flagellar hook-associated protein FlgK [Collimonas sp.]
MANSMFFTGLSGLNAAQAALVTTGHNTANVNTPGYSRQSAQIVSAGGTYTPSVGFFGNGAQVVDVSRSYDQFLSSQLNQAQSTNQALSTYSTQINQINNLLANQTTGLAPMLQTMFKGVQAVANTPADPAARQQLISSGQALANQFRTMSQVLTGLNSNANDQISGSIDQINAYATQIASINKQIALLSNAAGGQAPNDLLDQRDTLVNSLGQLVATKVVVQDGGQYNVFIGSGQTLVLGDKSSTLKAVTAAADPSHTAVALVNAAGVPVELQDSVLSGGSLGGLMQFRNQTLGDAQNALGRMAIGLSDSFNAQHELGVDLNGAAGQAFFTQASPGAIASARNTGSLVVTPSFSNTSQLTTSDYRVDYANVAGTPQYSVTRLSDNKVLGSYASLPVTFDGVSLQASSGTPNLGDSFLVQPTRTGARDLTVIVTDPAKIAAASPIITGKTATNQGNASISAGTVDATYLATPLAGPVTLKYDSTVAPPALTGFPATAAVTVTNPDGTVVNYAAGAAVTYTAGAAYSFNGITATVSGKPVNGDTFTIGQNTGGVSDGSNALLLGALQNKKILAGGTASYTDAYGQLVSTIGNKASQLTIANTAQTSLAAQIKSAQQSVSGVNQDEETANLLMYQQMYQANAKVIQTASTMFDAILGIGG